MNPFNPFRKRSNKKSKPYKGRISRLFVELLEDRLAPAVVGGPDDDKGPGKPFPDPDPNPNPDNGNVIVDVNGDLIIDAGPGDNNLNLEILDGQLVLINNVPFNDPAIGILDGIRTTLTVRPDEFTGDVFIDGGDGDDKLDIGTLGDFNRKIFFDGQNNNTPNPFGDGLEFKAEVGDVHVYLNGPGSGEIDLHNDGTIDIVFDGLEPVVVNPNPPVAPLNNLIFTITSTTMDAQLRDNATAGMSELAFTNNSFEDVQFPTPTNSLTINLQGGNSLVELLQLDSSFNTPNITFNGLAGDSFRSTGDFLPNNSAVTLQNQVELDLNGNPLTIGSITGDAGTTLDLTGGSLNTGGNDQSTEFAGLITGNGTLAKGGTGTFTISNITNDYTGTTSILDGRVVASLDGSNFALSTTDVDLNDAELEIITAVQVFQNQLDAFAFDISNGSDNDPGINGNGDENLDRIGIGAGILLDNPDSHILIDGTDRIDYRNDNDFNNGDTGLESQGFNQNVLDGLPGLNQNDNFATMFVGEIVIPDLLGGGTPYDVEIGTNRADDPVQVYLDLNQDQIFQAPNNDAEGETPGINERVLSRDCCGDDFNTITIAPGTYRYMAVQLERGGGSQIEPTIDLTPDAFGRRTVRALDPDRPGLFQRRIIPPSGDLLNDFTVTGNSTVILTDGPEVSFSDLDMNASAVLNVDSNVNANLEFRGDGSGVNIFGVGDDVRGTLAGIPDSEVNTLNGSKLTLNNIQNTNADIVVNNVGNGTVVLPTANNLNNASWFVGGGTFQLQNGEALGSPVGTNPVVDDGRLLLSDADLTGNEVILRGGSLESTGNSSVNGVNLEVDSVIEAITGTLTINGTIELTDNDPVNAGTIFQDAVPSTTSYEVTFVGNGNINAAGNIVGSGAFATPGSVTKEGIGTTTLSANNNYVGPTTINNGVLALSGNGTLGTAGTGTTVNNGGTLLLNGLAGQVDLANESVTINGSGFNGQGALNSLGLDAVTQFGYHIGGDSQLDLDGNGGLMGGGSPANGPNFFGAAALTDGPGGRGLDFNDDGDFIATGAIGQNDQYSNLFLGIIEVTPANAGLWRFDVQADDDRTGMWLDLNGNGIFESSTPGLGSNRGEQLAWEDGGEKQVNLTPGLYLFAATHREGGGGSQIHVDIQSPTMSSKRAIRPTDPEQDFWLPGDPNLVRDVILGSPARISSSSGVLELVQGISVSSDLEFGGGGTVEVSGVMTNTEEITKIENGTLRLTNGLNDFSGNLIAQAGTVSVTEDGALGLTSGTTTVNGTLQFDGTFDYTTLEEISLVGTISNTGDTLLEAPVTLTGDGTLASASGTLTLFDAIDGILQSDPLSNLIFDGSGDVVLKSDFGNANTPQEQVGIGHYGYHIGGDDQLNLHNNGGLMGNGEPTNGPNFFGLSVLTDGPGGRGLDFNDDGDFIATGSIGQNDQYSNLFLTTLRVSPADVGTWTFDNQADDDRIGLWVDLNQNGIFESDGTLNSDRGEQITWEDGTQRNVIFPAAGDYLVAFTHREGGGGSQIDFDVQSPTMTAERTVQPTTDPEQAGYWNFIVVPNNNVIKRGSGTATIFGDNSYNGDTRVEFGTLIAAHDNALGLNASTPEVGGSTLVFEGATLGIMEHTMPGPFSPVTIDEDVTLVGEGDEGNSRSAALVNIFGNNTLNGDVQNLQPQNPQSILSIGSDADELTVNGDITGGGYGSIVFGGAGKTVINGVVSNEGGTPLPIGLDHFGFHINNDGLALDLNNNGGMMGGGDPSSFQNFEGHGQLLDGPGNRGLDFNNDGDFNSVSASIEDDPSGDGFVIDQNDNYSNLFVGTLHVNDVNDGNWTFEFVSIDDNTGFWIDLDQDMVFESDGTLNDNRNEQITWDDGTPRTVTLSPGDYMVAFTHREGGGGSQIHMQFQAPSMLEFDTVSPTEPSQAGFWEPKFSTSPIEFLPDPKVIKTGSGMVTLNSSNPYEGETEILNGMLVINDPNALGDSGSGTVVKDGGSLGLTGNINLNSEALTIDGAEAIVNISDSNTITANTIDAEEIETGEAGINSLSGLLTINADIDLKFSKLTVNGDGDTTINGNIFGFGTEAPALAELVDGLPAEENQLFHFGYHINNDGAAMDLNNNGGLMGGGDPRDAFPGQYQGVGLLTSGPGDRGLDFNGDGDYTSVPVIEGPGPNVINQNDNYSNLFLGVLTVDLANEGDWQFVVDVDDDPGGIWIDLNQNGVFESTQSGLGSDRGEQLVWNQENSVKTVNLTAGDYIVAFTHREGGGGSQIDIDFKSPTMAGLTTVNPADPAQDGLWSTKILGSFEADNSLMKMGNGTLQLTADNSYNGETIVMGGTLDVDGEIGGPQDLVSYQGDFQADEFPFGWEYLWNATGSLDGQAETTSLPGVNGGVTAFNAIAHYGFHANNDSVFMNLNNNGGMFNGGDPLSFQNFNAAVLLTNGPGGRGLDFDNDADFQNSGAIGGSQDDNYSNLFVTTLTVPVGMEGTWTFTVDVDDDPGGIWLDLNQNGIFESIVPILASDNGEQLVWNQENAAKSVELEAGDYLMAFTHREGGGGSQIDIDFSSPTISNQTINPSDPAQAGLWSTASLSPPSIQPLEFEAANNRYETQANGSFPDAETGAFMNLTPTGGHPGRSQGQNGSQFDRFVIATYEIGIDGLYSLTNTFLDPLTAQGEGNQVKVLVESGGILTEINDVQGDNSQFTFDTDLGFLQVGDKIWVASGPNGSGGGNADGNDNFEWDFTITRATSGVLIKDGGTLSGNGTVLGPVVGEAGSNLFADGPGTLTIGDGTDNGFTTQGMTQVDFSATLNINDTNQVELGQNNIINGVMNVVGGEVELSASDNLSGTGIINADVNQTGPLVFDGVKNNADNAIAVRDVGDLVAGVNFGPAGQDDPSSNNGVDFDLKNFLTGMIPDGVTGPLNYTLSSAQNIVFEDTSTMVTTFIPNTIAHYGFHINNDGVAMDLNNNGGMLGGGDPTTFSNFNNMVQLTAGPGNRGLDFDNDGDFHASGAIASSQNDNYSNLFLTTLRVPEEMEGDWTFTVDVDDDPGGIWIDLNQNGVFESIVPTLASDNGEQLVWNQENAPKSVELEAGDYLMAFTHREGGGGSQIDIDFSSPTISNRTIAPLDPAQDGLWNIIEGRDAIDDLFFSEARVDDFFASLNLAVDGLDPTKSYQIEVLHGDARFETEDGDGTFDIEIAGDVSGQTTTIDDFTFGTGIGGKATDPEAKKTVSFTVGGETGFSYNITPDIPAVPRVEGDGLLNVQVINTNGANPGTNTANWLAVWDALDLGGPQTGNIAGFDVEFNTSDTETTFNYRGGNFPGSLSPETINNDGPGGGPGPFGSGDPSNYSIRTTAFLAFNTGGTYTISMGSDDGRRIELTEATPGSAPGYTGFTAIGDQFNGTFNPGDTVIGFSGATGHDQTVGTFTVAAGDILALDAFYYEGGGGDSGEISIASGSFANFTNTTDFQLLQDGVQDIAVSSTNSFQIVGIRPASISGFQVREIGDDGAEISPGDNNLLDDTGDGTVGTLNTQALNLDERTNVDIDFNLSDHDRIVSSGPVDINGALLDLDVGDLPGAGPYVILDGSQPHSGIFNGMVNGVVVPLTEGFEFIEDGKPLQISYLLDGGNDVELSLNADPIIDGDDNDAPGVNLVDHFLVREDSFGIIEVWQTDGPGSGATLVDSDLSTPGLDPILATPLALLNSLTINGHDLNDTLTIDYGFGGGFFDLDITFNGGADNDELFIDGGTITTAIVDHTGIDSGTIDIDGATITYTGLEPINLGNSDAAPDFVDSTVDTLIINLTDLPAGPHTGTLSTIGSDLLFDGPTFESVRFNGSTTPNFTVNGDDDDQVNIDVDPNLTGNLNVTSGTINVNNTMVTTGGDQVYDGAVVLNDNLTVNGANVTFAGTVDSDGTSRMLTVNSPGTTNFQGDVGENSPLADLTTDSAGTTDFGSAPQTVGSLPGGLQAYLPFDVIGVPGANQTPDQSGNGRNGTLTGNLSTGNPVPGIVGNAIDFQNDADHVDLIGYPGVTGTNDRSMAAWVMFDPVGGNDQAIMSWATDDPTEKWIFRVQSGNGTVGAIRVEVNGGFIVGSTDIRDGQWHHVAATFANDGSPNVNDVLLYVDGQLETISAVQGQGINTSIRDVEIGQDHSDRDWTGLIDEVGIWDRVLTAGEIASLAGGGGAISVTTTGDQTYNDAVEVIADVDFIGNNASFNDTLDGSRAVSADFDGDTTFTSPVGNITPLQSLTILNGSGTTHIDGGSITTSEDQQYGDPVELGANTVLDGNLVSFFENLDATSPGAENLQIVGNAQFGKTVGGTVPLGTLDVTGVTTFGGLGAGLGATLDFNAETAMDANPQIWEGGVGSHNINFGGSFGTGIILENIAASVPGNSIQGISNAYLFTGSGVGDLATLSTLAGDPSDASATWEIWFRPDADGDTDLLFETGGNGDGMAIQYNGATNEVLFTMDNGGTQLTVQGGSALLDSLDFHQVVAVYTKNTPGTTDTLELYIDNQLVASNTSNGLNDWAGGDAAALGNLGGGSTADPLPDANAPYEGHIAQFRFYERALTLDEVNQTFEALTTSLNVNTLGDQDFQNVLVSTPTNLNSDSNVTFSSTVDSGAGGKSDLVVNAVGTTTFLDNVGSNSPLTSLTTDSSGTTKFGPVVPPLGNLALNYDAALDPDGGTNSVWENLTATAGFDLTIFSAPPSPATLEYDAGDDDGADNVWENTGTTGGRNITNLTGANFNGSPATSIPGITGAYEFDGSGGGDLQSFNDLDNDSDVSFELWIRPSDLTGDETIFETGGGTGIGITLGGGSDDPGIPDSAIVFSVTQGGNTPRPFYDLAADPLGVLNGVSATTEFIQVVGLYDESTDTAFLYVNGQQVASDTAGDVGDWSGGDGAGIGQLGGANQGGFGGGPQGFTNYQGEIAIFRFYQNDLLTPGEIERSYNELLGLPTTPAFASSVTDSGFVGINSAYVFDGGSGFTSASLPNDTQDASFEVWFRPADLLGNETIWETGGGNGMGIVLEDNIVTFSITQNSGGNETARVSADLSGVDISQFIQIVGTFDFGGNGTSIIYVNGVQQGSATSSANITDFSGGDASGVGETGGANQGGFGDGKQGFDGIDGEIAILRQYSGVLSPAEVAEQFQAISGFISVTTTEDQFYADEVLLTSDVEFNGNDISFASTIDSMAGMTGSVTVNTTNGGVTSFADTVGGTNPVSTVVTNPDGHTEIGAAINTDGEGVEFNDAVLLTADVVITELGSANVTFGRTIDSAAGNNFALTINTLNGGDTTFQGNVGNDALDSLSDDNGLGSLTTDMNGQTLFAPGLPSFGIDLSYDAATDPDGGTNDIWEPDTNTIGGNRDILLTAPAAVNWDADNETAGTAQDWEGNPSPNSSEQWNFGSDFGTNITFGPSGSAFPGLINTYSFTGTLTAIGNTQNSGLDNISGGDPSTDDASWEIWFRPSGNDIDMLFETGGGGNGMSIVYDGGANEVVFTIDGGGTQRQVRGGSGLINETEFHQLVAVYNKDTGGNDQLDLYIDGVLVDSIADTNALNDWDGGDTASLGSTGTGIAETTPTTTNYEGDIAKFRFYRSALALEEVTNLFNDVTQPGSITFNPSPTTSFPGISASYDFDGPRGSLTTFDNVDDGSDASFEIWFRPDDLVGNEALFETGGGTGTGIVLEGNMVTFSVTSDSSGTELARVSADLSGVDTSEFVQVVGTLDMSGNGTATIYVNGLEIGSNTASANITDWSGGDGASVGGIGGANMGGYGGGNQGFSNFDGEIAIFRVYVNQLLTPAEVMNNFQSIAEPQVSVTTTGDQTYDDAVVLDAEVKMTTGTAVNFNNNVDASTDGVQNLEVMGNLNVGDGDSDAIGGTTKLGSLLVSNGGTTTFNSTASPTVSTDIDQTYTGPVNLTLDANLMSMSGGTIELGDVVEGPAGLIVDTTGTSRFNGQVGVGTALSSLTVVNSDGTTELNGGIVTTSGDQNYGDEVLLGADTDLNSGSGDVTFSDLLDGSFSLNVNSSGNTTFNDIVGGSTPLTSLTTDMMGTVTINADVTTDGNGQTYNDNVTLTTDAILEDIGGGDIFFKGSIDGAFDLTVNTSGVSTFMGEVGGNTELNSLTTDMMGSTALNDDVSTNGDGQTYNDNVTLSGDVILTDTAGGDIFFKGTLDSDGTPWSLEASTSGDTTFSGFVGGSSILSSLTTNAGGTTHLDGGGVNTSGNQTYGDDVELGDNTNLTSTANGDISFDSTVNGAFDLSVMTGGDTTFTGQVGNINPLTNLTTDAGGTTNIDGGSIDAATQIYNDDVVLGVDTLLTGNVTFNANANGTSPGGEFLDIDGDLVVGGSSLLGNNTALESLDVSGTTEFNNPAAPNVITSDFQNYNGAVTLNADTTLTSSGNGDISFQSTIDGGSEFVVNTGGTTIFEGVIGGNAALASLTTDAPGSTDLNSTGVTTTGDQTYNDAVILTEDVVIDANDITFASTIDGDGVSLRDLTINSNGGGVTSFQGDIGVSVALGSITTNADGMVVFGDPVTHAPITVITAGGTQQYNEIAVLTADTTLMDQGNSGIILGDTVDGDGSGPYTLTITNTQVAPITIGGDIGGTNPLAELILNSPGTATLQGNLMGANTDLTKNDGGQLILGGDDNSYGGTTNINAGNVDLQGNLTGTNAGPFNLNQAGITLSSSTSADPLLGRITDRPVVANVDDITVQNLNQITDSDGTALTIGGLNGQVTNTTVSDSNEGILATAGSELSLTGVTAENNVFGIHTIDATLNLVAGNTIINPNIPTVPNGLDPNLVDSPVGLFIEGPNSVLTGGGLVDSFGDTAFEVADLADVDNSGLFIKLADGAFFENGEPKLLPAENSTFNGIFGDDLAGDDLTNAQRRIEDFNDKSDVGLIFFAFNQVFVQDGLLSIIASPKSDRITVETTNTGSVTVRIGSRLVINEATGGTSYDLNDPDNPPRVKVLGLEGDDRIRITGNVSAEVFGGAGSDNINTQDGEDLIFGGADNDRIRSGGGNDTVIGGQGRDRIDTVDGNDDIIGGNTTLTPAELEALLLAGDTASIANSIDDPSDRDNLDRLSSGRADRNGQDRIFLQNDGRNRDRSDGRPGEEFDVPG